MKHIRFFENDEDYNVFIETISNNQSSKPLVYSKSGKVFKIIQTLPFHFTNLSNASCIIGVLKNTDDANTVNLEFSSDCLTWETWGTTSTTSLTKELTPGAKLYIRTSENVGYFNNSESNYNYFTASENVSVGGNVMSLCYKYYETKKSLSYDYALNRLFSNMTTLISAKELNLSLNSLSTGCYHSMFINCTNLQTTPELGCVNLANACYRSMFYGCSSLTKAPALPATTLYDSCYASMFNRCSSLLKTPVLPATSIKPWSYYCMFYNCTSLNNITPFKISETSEECCNCMFYGCSSVVTPNVTISADTVYSKSFNSMFNRCTSLIYCPDLSSVTNLAINCYNSMFYNCTSLITITKLPATTLTDSCYRNMFSGCSILENSTELPATTLVENCYQNMFYNCYKLKTAPYLPALHLKSSCYEQMFNNCNSLSSIRADFVDIDPTLTKPLNNWLYNVSHNDGIFIKNPDSTWDVVGYSGVPEYWSTMYSAKEIIDLTIKADDVEYANVTTTTIHYSLEYIDNKDVRKSVNVDVLSNSFGENTTGEPRTVEISLTRGGLTATTTITQGILTL